jgi:hypothetical protein
VPASSVRIDNVYGSHSTKISPRSTAWPSFTDSFWHDRYEYGEPGSCASGPPQCGDGMCQTNGCELGESGAGQEPGNGCEEDAYNCSDCG